MLSLLEGGRTCNTENKSSLHVIDCIYDNYDTKRGNFFLYELASLRLKLSVRKYVTDTFWANGYR